MISEITSKIGDFVNEFKNSLKIRKSLIKLCDDMRKDKKETYAKGVKLGGGVAKDFYVVERDSNGRFVKWKRR
jgi:hypothetical protein|tara:strand:- start:641 stop:859 length:219 start_codon:yes stop_codon:yes gene_type:complete